MNCFIKKAVSLLICIGVVFATVPAFAAEMQVVIDSVAVDRETDTVTVSGHIENYIQLFMKQYITLSVTNTSNNELRNIAQLEPDESGRFRYSFVHNGKGGTEHCTVTARFTGVDEAAAAHYYVTGGSEFDLFKDCLAFAPGAQTYFNHGVRKETPELPFFEEGELYIPKSALSEEYAGVSAIPGTVRDGTEFVSLDALNGADIPAYYDEASGIGTVGGEQIDANSLSHSKGMFGVYVSAENGSDSAEGCFDAPVATIQRAIEVASAKAEKPIIYLCDELYRNDSIIEIKSKSDLSFKAYSGVTPEITKAVHIPASAFAKATKDEAAAFSAKIPENTLLCVDLTDYAGTVTKRTRGDFVVYDNGSRAQNSRWPNGGAWETTADITGVCSTYDKIGVSAEKAALWGSRMTEGFLQIYAKHEYGVYSRKITSSENVEKDGENISLLTLNGSLDDRFAGRRFYTENIPAELDTAHEWYIDTNTNKLYYYPGESFDGIDITLPKQQSTVTVPGIGSVGDAGVVVAYSTNISFDGISFSRINGDAVSVIKSTNVDVKDGSIYCVGKSGVNIQGSVECDVENMLIYDTADSGVDINNREWNIKTGYDMRLEHENNRVADCDISNVGALQSMAAGVNLYGCGNTVENCIIHDINHQAAYIHGPEHTFEKNDIYGACIYDSDAAMVYAAGMTSQGTVIRGNAIHDQPRKGWYFAIYLDNAASGITVEDNYIHDISANSENGGIWVNGGMDVTIQNNIIANIPNSYIDSIMQCGTGWHKIILPGQPTYNALVGRYGDSAKYRDIWIEKYPNLFEFYKKMVANVTVNEDGSHTCADKSVGIVQNLTFAGNVIVPSGDTLSSGLVNIQKFVATQKTNIIPKLVYMDGTTAVEAPSVPGHEDNIRLKYSDYKANEASYLARLDIAKMGVPTEKVLAMTYVPQAGFPYNNGIYGSVDEISWNRAPGADKYRVVLSANEDLSNPILDTETIYASAKIGEKLESGTYYYRVDGIRSSTNSPRTDTGEVRSFVISDITASSSSGSMSAVPCDGSVTVSLPESKYAGITADKVKLLDKDKKAVDASITVAGSKVTVSGTELLAPERDYIIEISHDEYPVSIPFKTAKKLAVTSLSNGGSLDITVKSLLEKMSVGYDAFYVERDSQGGAVNVQKGGHKTVDAGKESAEQFSTAVGSASGELYLWDGLKPLTDKIKIK